MVYVFKCSGSLIIKALLGLYCKEENVECGVGGQLRAVCFILKRVGKCKALNSGKLRPHLGKGGLEFLKCRAFYLSNALSCNAELRADLFER